MKAMVTAVELVDAEHAPVEYVETEVVANAQLVIVEESTKKRVESLMVG